MTATFLGLEAALYAAFMTLDLTGGSGDPVKYASIAVCLAFSVLFARRGGSRLMAAAMVGEGTSYADLTYTINLNSEEYGVGFRKGSDLAAALNDFFAASWADGTMQTLADTYGVTAALIPQE